ncbi:Predicted arabinose efflux permease, MFS family [Brevibacterium sp. 239c]|uniref:MFS transporter n=1 Tax=Brevibacterium sp. 239c TaxID=1965356 RepID=UPI000C446A6F|nr:MFS transporter [Brevibacterium sp. 239c]SMX72602.1 Predicted arabinose efflux permease, MFS family [Brevibacterium sp. 239c]
MSPDDAPRAPTRPPLSISLAAFVSSFDRFAISPLIVLVAHDLGATLAEALTIASAYFLAYGVSQPVWGILSDRLGRVRLMKWTLLAAALTGVAATFAPTLSILVIARALSGAFYGAIVPTSMTYVGDTVDEANRQPALTDLMAAIAVGTASATALAGVLAHFIDWRVVFAIPAVLAVGCAFGLRRLPEPPREQPGSVVATIRAAITHRWVLIVIGLAFIEGAVVLGVLTLLAPALQSQGTGAAIAGLATAAYGVGVIITSRMVKALSSRLSMPRLIAIGGSATVLAFGLLAAHLSITTVIIAALLLGATWSFQHSSLQTWATGVLPQARGTVVSFFAGTLFAGSAVGAAFGGGLGDKNQWTLLFAITCAVGLVLTVSIVVSRRIYAGPRKS